MNRVAFGSEREMEPIPEPLIAPLVRSPRIGYTIRVTVERTENAPFNRHRCVLRIVERHHSHPLASGSYRLRLDRPDGGQPDALCLVRRHDDRL